MIHKRDMNMNNSRFPVGNNISKKKSGATSLKY